MLDSVRSAPAISVGSSWSTPAVGELTVSFARSAEDLEAVQRLRYQVFTNEMSAVFPTSAEGLDADQYDPWCEHLMVTDANTGRVVGTYRLLTPASARNAGGYYSESEFDLSGLGDIYDQIVEVGRSCTHPDYRNGAAIMLLWSRIAGLMQETGYRYLLGCASVSLRDDGLTAAEVWRRARNDLGVAANRHRVVPKHRYPVEALDHALPARIPPLIKGYMKLGAKICGEPAWDPDFNTADFPVLLDIEAMDERYRRHFGMV